MPPGAAKATESMFRRLLNSGSYGQVVHLRVFAFESLPGGGNAVPEHYESLARLWGSSTENLAIDGLIVTGTEPRASLMEDEPCWPHLQKVCDWAAENTISTIWSCFSSHAAVLHLDGIRRKRMKEKQSGVFQYQKASDHFLLHDMPMQWSVPHSRFNGLDETELLLSNYQILSHSAELGVDTFAKRHRRSEFLFFQGHPEYDPQTLFGEFSRDCRRFISGESTRNPHMPANYFDKETAEEIESFRNQDLRLTNRMFQPDFVKSVIGKISNNWREPSQQLVGAWISFIAEQKYRNEAERHADKNRSGAAG